MTARWEDLNARARGLATHLLTRGDLDALAHVPDVATLAAELRRRGVPVTGDDVSPPALDLALRRMAAARLRVLGRWCGPRAAVLAVLFEDEDRRSVRALLRGAVQGVPSDVRLAGLVPTPALPERALEVLARQSTPGAIAALLVAWRNPYGAALRTEAAGAHPDLFTLELALNRTYATRALRASRKAGRRGLLTSYVQRVIDLENAYTALVLAGGGQEVTLEDAFLPGGKRVSFAVFQAAAAAGNLEGAARTLAAAFAGTPMASAFERYGGDPAKLEDAVLRICISDLVRAAREAPLGPAPLLAYALRQRAELLDLRRIIWGVALGAPGDALAQDLVMA